MISTRRLVAKSMGARTAMLPVQAAATAGSAYVTIHALGVRSFATIGLLVGLQGLFMVVLNVGRYAVSNAAGASLTIGNDRLSAVLVSATRASLLAGGAFVVVVVIGAALGLMPTLLGLGDVDLLEQGAIVAAVGIGLLTTLSHGSYVLMALGHTVTATVASGMSNVIALGLVSLAAALDARPVVFVGCFYLAQVIVGAWMCTRAIRILGMSLRHFAASVANRSIRGASIASEAWPAFLIGLLIPAAYQSDRLLISHLSTATQLASYNLAIQLFTALLSVVGAGSDALWGHYANARARDRLPTFTQLVRISLAFAGVGSVLAVGYIATMSPIASIISGDRVSISLSLSLVVGALLILHAFHTPIVMVQTDPAGLRFYARLVLGMTFVNIALGLALTERLGAVGPVLASVIAMASLLVIPTFLRARMVLSSREETNPDANGGA